MARLNSPPTGAFATGITGKVRPRPSWLFAEIGYRLDGVALERQVEIPVDAGGVVVGDLVIPDGADGVVVFAHGSGSSRRSPRNRRVADGLRSRGFGTLLMDL